MSRAQIFDVAIAGAGIIGLSLALELRQRGLSVVVLDRGSAMAGASWAAGGMLAARDPENPPALLPLSLHSLDLYPEYLARIEKLSGQAIPLRTRRTLQQVEESASGAAAGHGPLATLAEMRAFAPGIDAAADGNFFWLEEDSLDPRDLCRALPLAARAAGVVLRENSPVLAVQTKNNSVVVETNGTQIHAEKFINTTGAWASEPPSTAAASVFPAKGQMVGVTLAAERLRCVIRIPDMYLIPRGDGRLVIGATLEYIGFDPTMHEEKMDALIARAATLLPELREALQTETWVGFRPATADGLPILSPCADEIATKDARSWIAAGHFRNGILLAPATARCLTQAMLGEPTAVSLDIFSSARFALATATGAPRTPSQIHRAVVETSRAG